MSKTSEIMSRTQEIKAGFSAVVSDFDDVSRACSEKFLEIAQRCAAEDMTDLAMAVLLSSQYVTNFANVALGSLDIFKRNVDAQLQAIAGAVGDVLQESVEEVARADARTAAVRANLSSKVTVLAAQVSSLEGKAADLEIKLQRRCEDPTYDKEIRALVWAMNDGHCVYCDVDLVETASEDGSDKDRVFHVEHIVAKAHGGPDHVHNYAPSCCRCNLQKATKSHLEFMKIKRGAGALRLVVSNEVANEEVAV